MKIVLDTWQTWLAAGGVTLAIIITLGITIVAIMKSRGGIHLKSAAGEVTIGEDTPEAVERRAPHECTQADTNPATNHERAD
jgi:hypothetical protein